MHQYEARDNFNELGSSEKMTDSLDKDRAYLAWHNQRGISHFMSQGHHWFSQRYLAAVRRLEKSRLKKDRVLLSNCCYMIGDVHDFNNCPKAAIDAYQESFRLDTTHSEVLREMRIMYESIGLYKKAALALKQSLEINPDDKCAVDDGEHLCSGGIPFYRKQDVLWQSREHLAKGKPHAALKLLKPRRSIQARQIAACAYGVLNDQNAVLEQWHKIEEAAGSIELTFADWFYCIKDCVDNQAAFWEIIARCARKNRFNYGVWQTFDSLYGTVIQFPAHRKRNSKADLARCNRCNLLLAQYHIARIGGDLRSADALRKKYPDWIEIKELCRKIRRRSETELEKHTRKGGLR